MPDTINCPVCGCSEVVFDDTKRQQTCKNCAQIIQAQEPFLPRRIFLSSGHDEHAVLAQRLKVDLEARGHEVWFDLDRLTRIIHEVV